MKYAFVYIMIVVFCLLAALRTINTNSIDNLITSIAPSIFELSSNIKDDQEGSDMIDLDQEKFKLLLMEEVKNNKTFYQGDILLEFYFYNVNSLSTCGNGISCNGVQIKVTMKAIYMLNKVKEYRYEVTLN